MKSKPNIKAETINAVNKVKDPELIAEEAHIDEIYNMLIDGEVKMKSKEIQNLEEEFDLFTKFAWNNAEHPIVTEYIRWTVDLRDHSTVNKKHCSYIGDFFLFKKSARWVGFQ